MKPQIYYSVLLLALAGDKEDASTRWPTSADYDSIHSASDALMLPVIHDQLGLRPLHRSMSPPALYQPITTTSSDSYEVDVADLAPGHVPRSGERLRGRRRPTFERTPVPGRLHTKPVLTSIVRPQTKSTSSHDIGRRSRSTGNFLGDGELSGLKEELGKARSRSTSGVLRLKSSQYINESSDDSDDSVASSCSTSMQPAKRQHIRKSQLGLQIAVARTWKSGDAAPFAFWSAISDVGETYTLNDSRVPTLVPKMSARQGHDAGGHPLDFVQKGSHTIAVSLQANHTHAAKEKTAFEDHSNALPGPVRREQTTQRHIQRPAVRPVGLQSKLPPCGDHKERKNRYWPPLTRSITVTDHQRAHSVPTSAHHGPELRTTDIPRSPFARTLRACSKPAPRTVSVGEGNISKCKSVINVLDSRGSIQLTGEQIVRQHQGHGSRSGRARTSGIGRNADQGYVTGSGGSHYGGDQHVGDQAGDNDQHGRKRGPPGTPPADGSSRGFASTRRPRRFDIGESRKRRLRCVVQTTEPDDCDSRRCPASSAGWKYVSELVRHLEQKHRFYSCARCVQKFETHEIAQDHGCVKRCRRKGCKRYDSDFRSHDEMQCFLDADGQWFALYREAYPDRPVPASIYTDEQESTVGPELQAILTTSSGENSTYSDDNDMLDSRARSTSESSQSNIDDQPSFHTTDLWPHDTLLLEKGWADLHASEGNVPNVRLETLQANIKVLERSERELEFLVSILWKALTRSGSNEAHPDSAAWMMMKRHVPSILDEAAASIDGQLPQLTTPSWPTKESDFDFSDLFPELSGRDVELSPGSGFTFTPPYLCQGIPFSLQ